ncbi:MAG: hypothetical protein KatS3mg118_0547 [Paracoccaceae bacterium]|nr:MAG: hypothetical protein KatS3mg118_0547 [Paracoccaceae bacterium]
MTRDDPFAEPSDTEKTVVNINPARRRPAAAPEPDAAPAAAPEPGAAARAPRMPAARRPSGAPDPGQAATGLNPLNAAAAPLFALVGRIRNRAQHPDPDALRENVVREIQAFEARAARAGLPQRSIQIARYALCATIDDVVLNTPWGGRSSWTVRSMVGTFHKETVGGERFYELLARLEREPATNRELLEFLYVCLSLGFEGRLRVDPRGAERHLALRAQLARLIRAHRGPSDGALSVHWKGVELPHRPLSAWLPLWAIAATTAALLGVAWLALSSILARDTDRLMGQIAALQAGAVPQLERPAPPPPPPPPPPPQPDPRTAGGAAAEIPGTRDSRRAGDGDRECRHHHRAHRRRRHVPPPASDVLKAQFEPVIDRIAQALNDQPGPVIIAGHSDSDPLRSARFQNSNQVLSLRRAEAVMKRMAAIVKDPARLTAEGRGDKEPLVPNTTRENKALNRRIEVILLKSD